ncbi:MAG: peptidylprolyl isomerase [Bacteroidales bacterium]|nr:peptidylprolyl isomerase [Bacteroidales bacterium]
MKKIVYLVIIAVAVILLIVCGIVAARRASVRKNAAAEASEQAQLDSMAQAEKALKVSERLANLADEPVFDIITTVGVIRVKLYADTPKHKANFAKLALEGFYDGILFHRVIYGFMIQTGDPLTKDMANKSMFGTGGPGYNVPAEFVPEHRHIKGALAAARRGDAANPLRESSGSQFYIVHDPRTCAQLDGQYTVFGETIEGFEVIDKIAGVETDARDCPINPIKIVKVELVK